MSTVEELTFQRDRWIKRTWCEIDLDCLKDNITLIQSLAKKTVIGVMKANAYGHGDVMIAKELQKAGILDLTCVLYPEDRHEILNELDKDQVYADILVWCERVMEHTEVRMETE